ncbi:MULTISPECIES: hypothetical protein [Myxococcus]|uniref:Lipoprotein n=1 Tax=Myxococcus xanthus TaxID=34 RepID=A0AAE6G056_MYXXA|nr:MULTISPECIES: hypothetical protein [Myxococcus]QDE68266.1 hypothetical protein BHS09_15485 [Myxococcus xanthus]QDE75543.1 hypothetical protein BHS08_15500 [Myxococcus xanthus]WAM29590.1 hypothetical protein OZ403_16260 [Myxococcus sp. NMCA1]
MRALRLLPVAGVVLILACSEPAGKALAKQPTAAEVLGVKPDFTPRYEIINMDRLDIAGVPRLLVRVRVPRGLSREDLESNVRHALLKSYDSVPVRLGAVSVAAYGSERMNMGADAAIGEFAPGGQWSAADPGVPLSEWQAKISLDDSYFNQRSYFAKGTRATLVFSSEFSDTISLSRKADRWLAEDLLAELKPGVSVVVVGYEDFGKAGVRYEVETANKPKRKGWVHSFALKAE